MMCSVSMLILTATLFSVSDAAAGSSPGDGRANVPMTTREDAWLLHVPPEHQGPVIVRYVDAPAGVMLLDSRAALPVHYENETVTIDTAAIPPSDGPEVIVLQWQPSPWEKQIARFEEDDRARPPAGGGIVFYGSSSIVFWDLSAAFPDLPVLNRGFGGCEYWDLYRHAHRVIGPHRPGKVVLYAGDNDIARGKSPDRVMADFVALVRRIRDDAPDAEIIVIGIKPSIARWDQYPAMREVNARMAAFVAQEKGMRFTDLSDCILGDDGKPRPGAFVKDGLHLSAAAYQCWTERIRPLLLPTEK